MSLSGSTMTWYSRVMPPKLETSTTPGTLLELLLELPVLDALQLHVS
jgi:hypothetical protein